MHSLTLRTKSMKLSRISSGKLDQDIHSLYLRMKNKAILVPILAMVCHAQ
jgi:hypothetical protein